MNHRANLNSISYVLTTSLLASFLAFSPAVHAADRNAQSAYRDAVNECLSEQAVAAMHCEYHPVADLPESLRENYDRGSMTQFIESESSWESLRTERSQATGVLGQLRELNRRGQQCGFLPSETQSCTVEYTNDEEFDLFVHLIQQKTNQMERAVRPQARTCFRACVAKCVTSVTLGYLERENQSLSEFLSYRYMSTIGDLWARGRGECSEIARLSTELGRSLGVPMRNVTTLFHEFNETKFGGRTYYLDAASPSCMFFVPR